MARNIIYKISDYLNSMAEGYFVIPIFQRKYDWTFENVKKLIEDLVAFYRIWKNTESTDKYDQCYYLGSIVVKYVKNSDRIVVDGQQRLTTIILILYVLSNFQSFQSDEKKYNINKLIYNHSKESPRVKLNRTNISETLEKIVSKKVLSSDDKQNNLYKNYDLLQEYLSEKNSTDSNYIDDLYRSFEHADIAEIKLSDIDNPTTVFETINTAGKPLEPCDLIKNYIFFNTSSLSETDESKLHDKFCAQVENIIGDNKSQNNFYRHFLAIVYNQKLAKKNSNEIYNQFKKYLDSSFQKLDTKEKLEQFVDLLIKHVDIYNELTTKIIPISNYKTKMFHQIFLDAIDTYYVLAHQMLYNLKLKDNSNKNKEYYFNDIMRVIAKYSIFNSICGLPEKKITRDIPTVFSKYSQENEIFEVKAFEKWFTSDQCDKSCKMRTIEDVRLNFNSAKMYSFNKIKTQQILKCIELSNSNGETKEQVMSKKFTVEHIMPQKSFDNSYWKEALLSQCNNDDQQAKQLLENTVHTLPNLTLVMGSLNSKLSNNSFDSKKKDYLLKTTLSINNELNKYDRWTKKELSERSNWMIDQLEKMFL